MSDPSGGTSRVTLTGGYNVPATGAPSPEVRTLPLPDRLFIPLESCRFAFGELRVEEGQRVERGQVLAVDTGHYSVPVLAPCASTVRLSEAEGHIVLDELEAPAETPPEESSAPACVSELPQGFSVASLVDMGVWQFLSDVRTGAPVDPSVSPSAVMVSVPSFEPFLAGGEAQLPGNSEAFARALSLLHLVFPGAAVCAVVPDTDNTLADEAKKAAEKCGCARVLTVPLRYPFDHPALLARLTGLAGEPDAHLWAITLEGMLALDGAITHSRPWTERVISLAGPAVAEPVHFRAVPGYPIEAILKGRLCREPARVVEGGILTGRTLPEGKLGLGAECTGLTVLGESTVRTFMAFARPGVSKRSYNRSFVGTYRPEMGVRFSTALGGELRPCISCGQCVDVCPSRIMPNIIHKTLYAHDIERAIDLRVDLCIECGLCSYVCPSKIDLRQQFIDAKAQIQADLESALAMEVEA
ncbi:MAG TPA: 4Fe-4S dicluster domain-containing protein [bacterium]|nr:4Fe-4S dicluster domain-containing protein [bacterium]